MGIAETVAAQRARWYSRRQATEEGLAAPRYVIPIACATLVFACAHAPPPLLHSTPLIVLGSSGGFRPLVRARVAGEPIMLLVDTGAFRSTLPLDFVRARNLVEQLRGTEYYLVDANGHGTQMQLLSGVSVQFDGEATAGKLDFLVNPSEAGGQPILAPQDLVRFGWSLTIDLAAEELRYEPEQVALKRLQESPTVPLRRVDFVSCSNEEASERAHRVVNAKINGIATLMLVDTGASRTMLARNNPALPSMVEVQGSQQRLRSVTSTGQSLLVEHVKLAFSQESFVLDVVVSPVPQACAQGALGADLLRHCTIVWGWNSLWAACHTPAETPAGR